MKYSILSVLVGSLLLAGCGGGSDKKNTQSDTPTPVQPQPDANTAVLTLGSNNNIVSLSNVAQATFSTEDAKNNPVITIQKAQDKDLVEPFNWAKQVLDIENGSDYELTLTSSKPLGSTVDMELSVPAELIHALNDQNALAAYIVTTVDEDDSEQGFVPVISTYNPETQKLLVTLPDWALQADDSDKPVNVTMKIGLAKAITDEPATPLTAMARMLTLPTEGESVKETQDTFKLICPVQNAVSGQKNICAETSRFGERNKGTIGKANFHYGLDFEAKIDKTHGYPLIAASAGTVIGINIADNSIAMRVDVNGKESTFVYRHLSEIDNNIKVIDEKNHISGKVTAGTLLGKAGNKNDTPVPVHLHLELINYSLPVCIGDKLKDKTCQTGDHTDTKQGNEKKIKMYNDPFPHFVDSIKLVKTSPKDSAITTGQKFNLELQGFDINGNRITTEIDNKLKVSSASVDTDGTPMLDPEKKLGGIKIQPQGTLRSVNWSVNPASAYKVESDAKLGYQEKLVPKEPKSLVSLKGDDLKKRSSATVTVNQEEPATITAYWDGLENLKATYDISNPNQVYEIKYIADTCTAPDALGTMGDIASCSLGGWGFESNGNGKLYIKYGIESSANLIHEFTAGGGVATTRVNYSIPKFDKNSNQIILSDKRHLDRYDSYCYDPVLNLKACSIDEYDSTVQAIFKVTQRDNNGNVLGGTWTMSFPYIKTIFASGFHGNYYRVTGYEIAQGSTSGTWFAKSSSSFPEIKPVGIKGCMYYPTGTKAWGGEASYLLLNWINFGALAGLSESQVVPNGCSFSDLS